MGKLTFKIKQVAYRINLRNALQKSSIEELHICLEETRAEIERRNKRHGKK